MSDYGRRLVLDSPFDLVLGETCHALREEGFQVIARADVRDRFWSDLGRNFRHYVLLHAWPPELALEALERDPDSGTAVPAALAVYELEERRTAVAAQAPFAAVAADLEWRRERPELAALADRTIERVARVLERLQKSTAETAPAG